MERLIARMKELAQMAGFVLLMTGAIVMTIGLWLLGIQDLGAIARVLRSAWTTLFG